MAPEITLYGTPLSGHMHRVELLLRALDLPFKFSDAPASVRKSAAFKKLNPLGQIPVLQDGDLILSDSNAIMVYLVKKYAKNDDWLPNDPLGAAQVQKWLSIAAGEVRYGPSKARLITLWDWPDDIEKARHITTQLLQFMEGHLEHQEWLAVDHRTIADLACYSYVAHTPEGGVSLGAYPRVQSWLARVEALPSFKPMPKSNRK